MAIKLAPFAPTITEEDATEQAGLFSALASPVRLRILSLLIRYEGELCVDEITRSLDKVKQETVSYHLDLLRRAGLVDCVPHGTYSYYYLCTERFAVVQGYIDALAGEAR